MTFDINVIKREFVAGGTAGAIGIFVGFPMDLVKTQLQTFPDRFPSAWSCLKHQYQEGGFLGLFRGCIPPILSQGVINSLMFAGESTAMRFLEPNRKSGEVGSSMNHFIAGSAGGLLQCLAVVPSEVVKCTMQTTDLHGKDLSTVEGSAMHQTASTIKQIYRTEGIAGFYKGLGATALRDVPSIGVYFFVYKQSRDLIDKLEVKLMKRDAKEPSTMATMIAGGLAGTMSWLGVYPIDVVKTVTQVSTDSPVAGNLKSYKDMSSWEVGASLYRQYGMKVFFRGLGPTLLRAFPVNATTFFFYEEFKKILKAN